MTTVAEKQPPAWKAALTMMFNPGLVVKKIMLNVPWPFSLSVSCLAYTFFFMQTGLDLVRTGSAGPSFVAVTAAMGFVYGTAGVALIAMLAWLLTKAFGNRQTVGWAVSAFGLGYSSALVYALMGLVFSLVFEWRTSVAFGATGVLWAMGPMIAAIREMTGGRLGVSIVIATVCGGLLLFGWALIGKI